MFLSVGSVQTSNKDSLVLQRCLAPKRFDVRVRKIFSLRTWDILVDSDENSATIKVFVSTEDLHIIRMKYCHSTRIEFLSGHLGVGRFQNSNFPLSATTIYNRKCQVNHWSYHKCKSFYWTRMV